jgi:hypothetical protein
MTATKKNPTAKPVPHKADAALCLPSALDSPALNRPFDRTFDAIRPYPHRI